MLLLQSGKKAPEKKKQAKCLCTAGDKQNVVLEKAFEMD